MDSSLRPRDIQARIRAGESPQDVADAAGVPIERIAAFSDPVMAERDHVAGLARTHPVRRRGETTSHRTLRNAVADTLAAEGQDADEAGWDAWKLGDRRWRVRVTLPDGTTTADFSYDQMGRFSVADDDEAKRLIGDVPAADDLALVRLTQEPLAPVQPLPTPAAEAEAEPVAAAAGEDEEGLEVDDAFHEGDLAEVDGLYDIVPPAQSDLDVLYDMLSSFDEDSVKIYAGLVHPKEAAKPTEAPPVVEVVEVVETVEVTQEIIALPTAPDPADEPEPLQPPASASPAEPEQLSLLDEAEPEPKPAPKKSKRKRAAVPSWDEIMFGAPRADDN